MGKRISAGREVPLTCEKCRKMEDFDRGVYANTCKWLRRDKQCIDSTEVLAIITVAAAEAQRRMAKFVKDLKDAMPDSEEEPKPAEDLQ